MINPFYFFFLLFFFFILNFVYSKKRMHLFWDKQPVYRDGVNKYGILSKNPIFNIKTNNRYEFKNSKLSKNTIQFINQHFSKYNKFSIKYLLSTLAYQEKKKVINIELYRDKTLVGFIHGKPIKINLENREINTYYVDFLCVHQKYRNKNLASFLIAELINKCSIIQTFIFKKDKTPLPFNYIAKTSYYYKFIENIELKSLKNKFIKPINNLNEIYKFITKNNLNYKLNKIISFNEFIDNWIENQSCRILVEYKNNKIISVVIYTYNIFSLASKKYKTLDIENIFIENHNDTELISYFKNKYDNKYIITLLKSKDTENIINKNKFIKSMDLFYHMYNYNINKTLSYDMIKFNPLF